MANAARYCDCCGSPFWGKSLRSYCDDPECRERRRKFITRARDLAEAKLAEDRAELELVEASVKHSRPEMEEVAERVAHIKHPPDSATLAGAVRRVVRPAGARAMREGLLDVAAISVRWAAALPRNHVLEPNQAGNNGHTKKKVAA
jgi:hypothetical protein